MLKRLKPQKIIKFALVFIVLTIVGTLTHELAHFITAKYLGLDPVFHYGFVTFNDTSITEKDFFLTTLAGPLQTMSFGTIGFIYLLIHRKEYTTHFKTIDWIAFFLSLFWLRECFNVLTSLCSYVFSNDYYPSGDEYVISTYFNLPPLTLNLILGFIGFIICGISTFIILPKKYVLNLLLGAVLGTLSGYVIWFYFLGELILP